MLYSCTLLPVFHMLLSVAYAVNLADFFQAPPSVLHDHHAYTALIVAVVYRVIHSEALRPI